MDKFDRIMATEERLTKESDKRQRNTLIWIGVFLLATCFAFILGVLALISSA